MRPASPNGTMLCSSGENLISTANDNYAQQLGLGARRAGRRPSLESTIETGQVYRLYQLWGASTGGATIGDIEPWQCSTDDQNGGDVFG